MTLIDSLKKKLTTPAKAAREHLFTAVTPSPEESDPNEYRYNYWQSGFNFSIIASDILKVQLIYDLNGNMKCGDIYLLHYDSNFHRYFTADLVTNDAVNIYNPNKLYIIALHDQSNCYDKFEHEMYQLATSDTNVIGFNPAKIGTRSDAKQNPDDYQAAIRSIIDNLHANGIPFDNIVIIGHGFGAAMGIVVAAQYQEKNQRVKVFADRTFSSLAMLAGTKAHNAVYEYLKDIKFLRSAISFLAYYIANGAVRIFRLNIDAADAFTKINRLNPGDARALFVYNDQDVPEYCSMARSLSADILPYVKEFKCNPKLKAHYVNVRELMQHGEPVYKRNSGEFYVYACLDHFKERMLNPGVTNAASISNEEVNTESESLAAPLITCAKALYITMLQKSETQPENTNEERARIALRAYS